MVKQTNTEGKLVLSGNVYGIEVCSSPPLNFEINCVISEASHLFLLIQLHALCEELNKLVGCLRSLVRHQPAHCC